MSYEPLARKYRPKNFKEVVGQDHVVGALSNAIKSGRIHHAYLFAGTRGVGKTTMARILAKSLECLNSPEPTTEICGVCDACRGIAAGNFVDVQEIDGASNRGIDEIRNLRENVRYAPVAGRYKIFIIDEAHQITGAAFNALLKTLEEPPAHAVFILATTEASSIPPTIASRCQRYRFKSISEKDISDTLKKIISEEKIPFEDSAISIISRAAGGSMRDAESLAEQAIAYTDRNLTTAGVRELLGILPSEMIDSLFEALSSGDTRRLIELADKIMDEGYEPEVILGDMLSCLRAMLYVASGAAQPSSSGGGISDFEKDVASRYVSSFDTGKILRISRMLLKARDEMRWTEDARFLTEIYLAKITQPVLSADEILSSLTARHHEDEGGDIPRGHGEERNSDVSSVARPSASIKYKSDTENSHASDMESAKTAAEDMYKKLLSAIPSSEERLRACLLNVKITDSGGKSVTLETPSEFYANDIKRKMYILQPLIEKITGRSCEVIISTRKKMSSSSGDADIYSHPDGKEEKADSVTGGSVAQDSLTDQTGDNEVSGATAEDSEEAYYDESIFDAPASRSETENGNGYMTGGTANNARRMQEEEHTLPDSIRKIKDVFQGKVMKISSAKKTSVYETGNRSGEQSRKI